MPIDRESQEYQELIKAIVEDGAILFVGAGSSQRLGYPSWSGLVSQLAEHVQETGALSEAEIQTLKKSSFELQGEKYCEALAPEAFSNFMVNTFSNKDPTHDAFHESLISIPFEHVITTNYDFILECAHEIAESKKAFSFDGDEWDKISDLITVLGQRHRRRNYVHIHGSIRNVDGIVFTQKQYDNRYVNETRLKNFLNILFQIRRVIFVGYSLSDFDLNYLLREIAGKLSLKDTRHFAILKKPEDQAKADEISLLYSSRYITKTVFFEGPEDYSELVELIEAAYEDSQPTSKAGDAVKIIEEVLSEDEQPKEQQKLPAEDVDDKEAIGTAAQLTPSQIKTPSTESSDGTELDKTITEIFKHVYEGNPDEAIRQYKDIIATAGEEISDRLYYRLYANIGNAYHHKAEFLEAIENYEIACKYYQSSVEARTLKAFALFLKKDYEGTSELCNAIREEEPKAERATALWIWSQPYSVSYEEIIPHVAEELQAKPEIALALSDRAHKSGNFNAGVDHAKVAYKEAPQWLEAKSTYASALLNLEMASSKPMIGDGYRPRESENIDIAISVLDEALKAASGKHPDFKLADIYYNRSIAYRLKGDAVATHRDLLTSLKYGSTDPNIVLSVSLDARDKDEINGSIEAINSLEKAGDIDDQIFFARARLMNIRNEGNDREVALKYLLLLSDRLNEVKPTALRNDITNLAIRIFNATGRSSDGIDYIKNLPANSFSKLVKLVMLGYAYLYANEKQQAIKCLEAIQSSEYQKLDWFELHELAELAHRCQEYDLAFIFWSELDKVAEIASSLLPYVISAYQTGHKKEALEICRRFWKTEDYTFDLLTLHIRILFEINEHGKLIRLLNDWIHDNPSDKNAVLLRSYYALHDSNTEFVVTDPHKLPSVKELPDSELARALVFVLRHSDKPERSLVAAYEIYRRWPDNFNSRQMLIASVFAPNLQKIEIDRPDIASRDCAISVGREGEAPRWIYVEPGDNPSIDRNEYSPDHPFIEPIVGKRAGDTFTYNDNTYQLHAVENRMLRRVHELMGKMEEDFPDQSHMRRFSLPAEFDDTKPIEEQLGGMYDILKEKDERREVFETLYRGNKIPLSTLAKHHGQTVFNTLRYFAGDSSLAIRCYTGEYTVWEQVYSSIDIDIPVVLDATALAAMLLLDAIPIFEKLPFKYIVAKTTLSEIRQQYLDNRNPSELKASLGLRGGKLWLHEQSVEQQVREVQMLQKVLTFVESSCEVVGGEATLGLNRETYSTMHGLLSESSLDSIALAKERSAFLWTDDYFLQQIASRDVGEVKYLWTQMALRKAMDSEWINLQEYYDCLKYLVIYGYEFTRLSAQDLTILLKEASWDINSMVGQALVRIAQINAVSNIRNFDITAVALMSIWSNCPSRDKAREIISTLLNGIGRQNGATALAKYIYRGQFWGIKATRSNRSLKRMLRSWRSQDGPFTPGAN